MTAHQAVLAVAVPAVAVLLILAVPAVRRRRAQHRRAVEACAEWRDDYAEPADLSTPDTVAPLAEALTEADPDPAPVYADPAPCTIPDCPTCATWLPEAVRAYEAAIQARVRADEQTCPDADLSDVVRPATPAECGHVYDGADTPMVCTRPAGHPSDHEDDRTTWPREETADELHAELVAWFERREAGRG